MESFVKSTFENRIVIKHLQATLNRRITLFTKIQNRRPLLPQAFRTRDKVGEGQGDARPMERKGVNVKRLFEFENVKLEFREDALTEIAKKAISKKTGARGLRSILESILLKTMFSLPDLENVDSVTVDKSVVKGKSDPILSYTKNKSTSAA